MILLDFLLSVLRGENGNACSLGNVSCLCLTLNKNKKNRPKTNVNIITVVNLMSLIPQYLLNT